ncbi:T9SS C-terminal target domain-containing protein [Epilithonimonas vandammei]|uniref:T9SS C-terminal target domain-containing protein n=1 Tax=Epilithonimonas vandammei TaxID=2487072 RepID=A0A3G8ZLA1_9FLAO|nr:T9SS type A sorting domain-containing protein [Epilithonimonas vandammei]AZI54681.1 T9SS C-terminal target domain-containing protein [Epilithonimonas vandammei]
MKKFSFLKTMLLSTALTMSTFAMGQYRLVTSTTDLESGAKYVLANSASGTVKLMGYQNTNNRPQSTSDFTVTDGKIYVSPAIASSDQTSAYQITLTGSTGAWVLNDTVNSTILGPAPTGNNNYLKANADANFTIAISGTGVATITAVGGANANGRNIVRYNNSASLFSCYSTGQADVYLYKYDATLSVGDATKAKANLVKNTIVSNELIFGAAAKVSVYNTAGQVVKTAEVAENSRLDVSALPKGTYVVTGIVNGQAVSQKVIKK